MRRRTAATGLTALALLAASGACADGPEAMQPTTTPTRDVDITYHLAAANGTAPAEQRVRWQVATGRQRIDPPTPGLHVIIDPRAHRLASVRDAQRLVLELDQGEIAPLAGGQAGHYTRRGDATVAGLACAVWQRDGTREAPLLCFTADGVLLRVADAGRVVLEAVTVAYAPSDPAVFEIPPDYRRIVRDPPVPPPTPKETTP
jgi:hypothetical protein